MSVDTSSTNLKLDTGLEWIKLRHELDVAREEDLDRTKPKYKYNWYMPIGLGITGLFLAYGITNMYDVKKSSKAAYCRIASQFICGSVFMYGALKHYNKELKLHKLEMRKQNGMETSQQQ